MDDREVKKYILDILEKHSKNQINLSSASARTLIAEQIFDKIRGKFHCVPYADQRDYE